MYYAYVLQSEKHHGYYTGSCQDIDNRLNKHNTGKVRSTKNGVPWIIVRKEAFETRSEAYRRELEIKSYKGGKAFKKLVKK